MEERQNGWFKLAGGASSAIPAPPSRGHDNTPPQGAPGRANVSGRQTLPANGSLPTQAQTQPRVNTGRWAVSRGEAASRPVPAEIPPRQEGSVRIAPPAEAAQVPLRLEEARVTPPLPEVVLRERMARFANSTTLRRVVHTKGFGAFGYFMPEGSMREYTTAGFLREPSVRTPVSARFSLAAGNEGTPDTSRNLRGFAVKFHTNEGEYDLLCNSIPVFFTRDAVKTPEILGSFAPSPVNGLPDPDRVWGMFAKTPEATHLLTWLYSDIGTAKSFRRIRAYGVNTYIWRNGAGIRRYVKYHWLPVAGEEYLDRHEAARLACESPDIAGRDLYDTIAAGGTAEFDLCVQLMDPADTVFLPYDPLDATKTWNESRYPLLKAGRLVLDRNPERFSEQVESLAFAPVNLVGGIEFSGDSILRGRTVVYSEAQRHRLGSAFHGNERPEWPVGESERAEQDDFIQAGQRFEMLSEDERRKLADNLAFDLTAASTEHQQAILGYLQKASPDLAYLVLLQMRRYVTD